ncbi:hypothetical protein [Azospirillum soli]|uniref:hypothetical protein n=1 Tax=Azospirillum soli TaxID=1304799 RepID=UPI001AE1FAA6|nr:hypothetical protein [Azospirillum soli]MBP2311100.1 putative membrane protein [Azospirillum soli]
MRALFLGALMMTVLTSAAQADAPGELLTPAQIEAAWVGKTLKAQSPKGKSYTLNFKADGSAEISGDFQDKGTWRLSDTGYCTTWPGIHGKENCFAVRKAGNQYTTIAADGSVNATITVAE